MINININSHKKTLEKFTELEKTMQDERESQLQLIEDLKMMWSGPARAALEKSYPYMLQEGLYGQTLEQVSGMRKIMEDALPAIRRQKSKCDTFVNCLRGGVPLASGAPDGNLMLEENAVSSITTMCDEVKSSSDSIESELNAIMDMCSGIVDFGSEREALYAACRKADRIIDLKEAIHSYCRDVLDLDEALRVEYAAWKDEETYAAAVRKEEKEYDAKMNALIQMLEERGITIEEYRASVLDTFMYLDIFNDVEGVYDYEKIKNRIEDGMTINEMLEVLSTCDIYTHEVEGSTRNIYYDIVKDAVEKDPELGNFEIRYMSREMKDPDGNYIYNKGTNGMTFIDKSTGSIYVAYRGTSAGEWVENALRLSVKAMDCLTIQMTQTIDYFEFVAGQMQWTDDMNIIVTGHSQGGNDAQISVLLSDYGHYVDKCFSFDGQGFSPELIEDVKLYMKEKFDENEYNERVSRMYSICGEWDFVNRLGEKVISEENTKYIKCNFENTDFARFHDIVSMFCDENMDYTGMINTGVGTEPSYITYYTAQLWDVIYEMPDSMRMSCQKAIMDIAEYGLSGGKTTEGLNGENASLWDYWILYKYGLSAIGESVPEAYKKYFNDAVLERVGENVLTTAVEHNWLNSGMAEELMKIYSRQLDMSAELYEIKNDGEKLKKYAFYSTFSTPFEKVIKGTEWDSEYIHIYGEKLLDYSMKVSENINFMVKGAIDGGELGIKYINGIITNSAEKAMKVLEFLTGSQIDPRTITTLPVMPTYIGTTTINMINH